MTTTPLDFLRTTLDAAEALALAAPGPEWEHRQVKSAADDTAVFEDYVAVADPDRSQVVLSDVDPEVLPFVLANSPTAVLRRIAADRKLLELHVEFDFPYNPDDGPGDYSWTARCDGCHEEVPCTAVRLLAEGWGWMEQR